GGGFVTTTAATARWSTPTGAGCRRGTAMRERGSALMLMPAAGLVFVVLGAIAVDFAVPFLGGRGVSNGAAGEVGRRAVASAGLDDLGAIDVRVEVAADAPVVTVTVSARVRYLFAKA